MEYKLRICLISPNLPPTRCGVGDYTYLIANELSKLSYDVYIITSTHNKHNDNSKVNLKIFPIIKNWDFRCLFKIVSFLKKNKQQIVNIQYVPFLYGKYGIAISFSILPLLIKLFTNCKVVTTLHELYYYYPGKSFWRMSIKEKIWMVVQYIELLIIVENSDAIITTTNKRKDKVKKLFPKKLIYSLPVVSNIHNFDISEEEKNTIKESIGMKDDFIISVFGTLHPTRDFETIIKALSILERKINNIKLLCIGDIDKNSKEYLKIYELIKNLNLFDKVFWTGLVPEKKVSHYLNISDVNLLIYIDGVSNRRGPLPAALLHKLPIIATKGDETDEIFIDHENIILIEKSNPIALANAIEELYKSDDLRKNLGENSEVIFKEYFDWSKIAKETLKIYEKVLQSKKNTSENYR